MLQHQMPFRASFFTSLQFFSLIEIHLLEKKSQNQGFQFQSIPEMMVLHIESLHCHYCQEMVDQKLCSQVQTQCDLTAIERNLSSKTYCQQLLLFSLMKRNQDPTLFCICKGCIEVWKDILWKHCLFTMTLQQDHLKTLDTII